MSKNSGLEKLGSKPKILIVSVEISLNISYTSDALNTLLESSS